MGFWRSPDAGPPQGLILEIHDRRHRPSPFAVLLEALDLADLHPRLMEDKSIEDGGLVLVIGSKPLLEERTEQNKP